ncbi:MAG: DMT family transporter [Deltaproteobacteria bacterium]|nr:DMT family transporter [Deltaproteobacteria bacterium]
MRFRLRRGALLMLLASVAFSLMAASVRACKGRIPFFEVAFFRSFVALVPVLVSLWLRRIPLRTSRPGLMLSRGLAGFASMALYFYGLTHLHLADSVMLGATAPIFVALLAPFALGEMMRAPVAVAISISVGGLFLLVGPSLEVGNLGGIAAAASGATASVAYIAIRKLSATEHPDVIVFGFTAIATVLSAVAMVPSFLVPEGVEWLLLVGAGIFAAVGQALITRAYAIEEAAVASALSYATVLFSWLIGVGIFDEPVSPRAILGGLVLVAVGTYLGFARGAASPPSRF